MRIRVATAKTFLCKAGGTVPGERSRPFQSDIAQAAAKFGVAKESNNTICDFRGILRIEEQSGVRHNFGHASSPAGKDWNAAGHRFNRWEPETFPQRWKHQRRGSIEQLHQVGVGHVPCKSDMPRQQWIAVYKIHQLRDVVPKSFSRCVTHDGKVGVRSGLEHFRHPLQERDQVFVRIHAAEVNEQRGGCGNLISSPRVNTNLGMIDDSENRIGGLGDDVDALSWNAQYLL